MHGGGPVTMIVSACYNGQRNIPCPKHDLDFFRNAQIFMWQDVGGPVKEKYQYIAPFIYCIKNGHVLYIMGLAYRRCLTNLPWGWNWATSCDPVPRLLSFTVQSPHFSKCGPGTSSISIIGGGGLVRNAGSQTPTQTFWIRIRIFTKPSVICTHNVFDLP